MRRLFPVLFVILVLVRLPSLAQPAGNDQGLYAYVGQAIARGEVPYRDAWDQKPPAIHFTYALMYGVWQDDSVVAAVDLAAACLGALLLVFLGRRLTAGRGAGETAALLFLLFGNPAFQRLGGLWVRGQCETFIAVLATAALLLVAYAVPERGDYGGVRRAPVAAAGLLLGIACLFKYNAITYAAAAAVTLALLVAHGGERRPGRVTASLIAILAGGCVVPVAAMLLYFALAGALPDLYHATITYNLRYSGETYGSAFAFAKYLLTFPVREAAVDSLWLLGGAGCLVLLVAAVRDTGRLVVPIWVAAACLAIAVNSGRGLPQYFVQANALLALAAGLSAALAWRSFATVGRLALVVVVAIAAARVSQFDQLASHTWLDVQYLRGNVSRAEYLDRFTTARTSARAVADLGAFLRARTSPSDRIFIFGFSGSAYVHADRASASRFFWSRPILAGFNEGKAGYGHAGLLADLAARRPAFIVLQQHDWPAEGIDSATDFMQHAALAEWLRARYELASENDTYRIWRRRSGA